MYGGAYYGDVYGGAPDEVVSVPANAVEHLIDNFDDNSLDTSKWTDWGGANVVETNHELEVQGTTAPAYYGIQSAVDTWALTSSHIIVNVVDAGSGLTDFEVYPFQLSNLSTGNAVLVYISLGVVYALKRVGGINTYINSILYVPGTTKWFRLREVSGVIFYDWSSDETTWTNFATASTDDLDMSNFQVDIFAGNSDTIASAQLAKFDSVNYHNLEAIITGTFLLSGSVHAGVHHTTAIHGTFTLSGTVDGAILPELKATSTKLYEYKVYDDDFNFLGRWDDVISDLAISQAINQAGSAIDVTLARNSDTIVRAFEVLVEDDGVTEIHTDDDDAIAMELVSTNPIGPGTTVDLNLNVKIFCFPENDGSSPHSVWIEAFGGGASGVTKTAGASGGVHGGGGGAYSAAFVDIIPGQTYTIVVGQTAVAPGTDGSQTLGGDSSFGTDVVAKGGGATTGGASASGTGDVKHSGGAAGSPGGNGGGGGGEGGSFTADGHAGGAGGPGSVGGLGGSGGDGGDGGAGSPLATNGSPGSTFGGGGGGAARVSTGTKLGGDGAAGVVIVHYDNQVFTFNSNTSWVAPLPLSGKILFTGYISKYVSNYGQSENTVVSLMSYGADMDNYVLEDSGSTRIPYLSQDPSAILKDALDRFNADGGIPSYNQNGTTVDITATEVSYTFNLNTILEVVKKVLELAPTDWYWYFDMALNNVHLHTRPSDPAHTFILGKHILGLNISKYIEDLVNTIYYTGGPLNPFVDDPFTDASTTVLTAHQGTEGAVWTRHPSSAGTGDLIIDPNNMLYIGSANDLVFVASGESLSNDYTVAADFVQLSATGSEWDLLIRMDPTAKTFYLARWIVNDTTFHIYKCVAGSFTDLASGTYSPSVGIPFNMALSAIGNTITLNINGNQVATATDAAIPTGVLSGIRTNGVADSNITGGHMDDFNATSQLNAVTNLFKKYTDATSISTYRRGLDRPSDNRVKVEASADIIAESELSRLKNPRFQSSVIISDKVYDIESIKLGELVAFRNFGNFIDGITLQIVRIDYTPDSVTLQLDTLLPSVTKRLEDVKRNLNQSDSANNPDVPSL